MKFNEAFRKREFNKNDKNEAGEWKNERKETKQMEDKVGRGNRKSKLNIIKRIYGANILKIRMKLWKIKIK